MLPQWEKSQTWLWRGEALSKGVIACLFAIFVADLPYFLIDFLRLPLPTTLFSLPWSVAIGFVLSVFFLPALLSGRVGLGRGTPYLLIIVIALFTTLEVARKTFDLNADFSLIISATPFAMCMLIISWYEQLFAERHSLIDAVVWLAIVVASAQLAIFVLSAFDVPTLNGMGQKNRLSILLVSIAFVSGVLDLRTSKRAKAQFYLLMLLCVAVCFANGARAALLSLGFTVALHVARLLQVRVPSILLLIGAAIMIGIVSCSYLILGALATSGLFGMADDLTSALIRASANWRLLENYVASPIIGIGWAGVREATSSGYPSHTLYLMIFAAYGLLGAIVMTIFGACWLYSGRYVLPGAGPAALLFLVLALSFFNDPAAWHGLLLALSTREVLNRKEEEWGQ